MRLAAPRAGDREVAKPSSKPGRRRRGLEHFTGLDRLFEGVDQVAELGSVDDSSSFVRVDHRDATMGAVANRDEEAAGHVNTEDVQSDSFRGTAVGEGAGNGQCGRTIEDQPEIHRIRVDRDVFMASDSEFVHNRFVEMRHQSFGSATADRVRTPREMRDPASNPMCDRLETGVGRIGVDGRATVRSKRHDRVHEISIPIQFGQ